MDQVAEKQISVGFLDPYVLSKLVFRSLRS
jgi:hypothetical protein